MTVYGPLPVHLLPPGDVPDPAPGCGVCAALAQQRAAALAAGDRSKAVDCNVELRNHPHTAGSDA
ncbi:hypothetical protein [Streptomyces sp. MUM 178J]|uniref:hypothetical protein n=1 Tax=Streptomyces sp. MUM 178J TaxID=2791991 RepID=UPI001F0485F6|nr:hypothetical protein [Streptomyces sp. MUM 178J]WRQ82801.1 hypothetical protein I3F59_027570 [Streptomyces sp. MUM 178J]